MTPTAPTTPAPPAGFSADYGLCESLYARVGDAEKLALGQLNLGSSLRGLKRYADAERAYRQALQLDPIYADAYFNLGTALVIQGRFPEAEAPLRSYMERVPHAAAGPEDSLVTATGPVPTCAGLITGGRAGSGGMMTGGTDADGRTVIVTVATLESRAPSLAL